MTDERRPKNRRFRLIMGTLAVAAIVSGGAAYAATQDDSPAARSQAIVNDAAGTLGVDPSKLSDALEKALENQVDAQVTAGKLTQAQADAIKKRIEDGTQPIFGGGPGGFGGPGKHFGNRGPGGPHGHGFGGPRGGPLAAGLDELGTFLGLSPDALRTQLESGKSLADIAKAQGKTVDDLKAAITAAVTKRLDAAVTAGKITKDQETKLLESVSTHLDDFVNGTHEARPFGHRGWKGDKSSDPNAAPAPPADPPASDPASWAPSDPAAA
jgi:hypothetical protein